MSLASFLSVIHFLTYLLFFFFFNAPATTEIYTLSLHDALPISEERTPSGHRHAGICSDDVLQEKRSEEHTSELQSPMYLVCRLLLEKKKKKKTNETHIRNSEE